MLGVCRCEGNVYINMRITRPASDSSGDILCLVMGTLEHGTRNPRVVLKSSSTEETKNHLIVNKMASNILLLKEKQKNPKEIICVCKIFVGFFPSLLTMCLLLVNAARSHKWNRRRKHRGMRCEQNS